jgi:hypothetical protein
MRSSLRHTLIPILVSLVALAAAAQTPPPTSGIDITGSVRVRAEAWDWFEAPPADGEYVFAGALLRVGAAQKLERLDWTAELAAPALAGLPDDAIAPAPMGQLGLGGSYYAANRDANTVDIFVKQAFVRFKGLGSPRNSLRVGRFEFADGSETTPKNPILAAVKRDRIGHRLIGTFGFSHVGRSFDGVQFTHDGALNATAVVARPTEGVFDVEGMGQIDDVGFAYGAITRPMGAKAEWRLFGIGYEDDRGLVKTDNRPPAARNADREAVEIYTVGGHYLRVLPTSGPEMDVLLWGALQGGEWGRQSHDAAAFALESGLHFSGRWSPSVRAGFFASSGDDDPGDDEHGSFFQILPTPRIYARFPFYNMMNNRDAFIEVIARPSKRVTTRADLHLLRLSEGADLWYSGGGAFQDGNFGYAGRPAAGNDALATLVDLSVDFIVDPKTAVALYLSQAMGDDVISSIYPEGDDARFVYLEVSRRF